jgi:hypothetical protein
MTTKFDERIETLETKLQQLKIRQQRIAARRAALLSSRARKDDTRRKILVGRSSWPRLSGATLTSGSSSAGSIRP